MTRVSTHSLGGTDWRLGYLKGHAHEPLASCFDTEHITRWFPARVPGNVRDDLMRAGQLPDLYFGDECRRHEWVNDCLWWYEKRVQVDRRPGERLFLDFRGIDYRSVVFWDHTRLGANEGMFTRQLYEVTTLAEGTHTLRVRVAGSKYLPTPDLTRTEALLRPALSKLQGFPSFPERFGTVKCQMSYGWDFAPDLRAMGIWDDVYLHVGGDVFLERVALTAHLAEDHGSARLDIRAAVNAAVAGEYTFEVTVEGDNCDVPVQTFQFRGYLRAGREVFERHVTVVQPELWHPWDRGAQALYRVTVRVLAKDRVVHEVQERFGFRDVRMSRNPDTPAGVPDWTFTINGAPVFIRGANWVPADSLPGRLRAPDYEELLQMVRDANINMLRVWGGGLREKQVFYDLCAEKGIMVWQEFPFACAFLDRFQRHDAFLKLVKKEVGAIVKTLHNAPAVIVHCGGNEFSPRRNEPVVEVMRSVVAALDPERPFFEASPRPGDVHNWSVWHNFANPTAYEADDSQFFSEFGLQALPNVDSFKQFLPEKSAWPPGPLWELHCAELEKLARYAEPAGNCADLPAMIAASQRAQAYALQVGIEHARLRKYACSGVMIWQFNEPWPAISWSVVDYFRRPKLAYETVRRCYAPILAIVRYPRRRYSHGDAVPLEVWMVNDTQDTLTDCRVELYMEAQEGRAFHVAFTIDEVPADSAGHAFEFELVLPNLLDLTLYVDVSRDGTIISSNRYDLGFYDPVEATPRDRWMHRLTKRLLA